jgi:hypothetical protein
VLTGGATTARARGSSRRRSDIYQADATFTLTAPDGTSVVLAGSSSFAQAATVFLVEEITGFDSPNVRQDIEDLPEQDGAVAGNYFFGSRPITIKGKVVASTASMRNVSVMSLQRALRGMTASSTLSVTGVPGMLDMQVYCRLDNVRITGGYIKDFILSLVCPDPLMYSTALHTQTASGMIAVSGVAFPIVFPANFGGGSGAVLSLVATNSGNYDSAPVVRLTGPINSPQLKNATTNETLYLDGVIIATSEYVDIDMAGHTAVKNDGTNLYGRVRFPGSTWWRLAPGANTIELRSDGVATPTLLSTWRDAWV